MPTTVTMMMFVVVDKHVVDGHLHVDAGALFLPRLAHNIFHWGSLVFIIFIFFHTTFSTADWEVWFSSFLSMSTLWIGQDSTNFSKTRLKTHKNN